MVYNRFTSKFSVARAKLNKFYVLIVTDTLSSGADLSKIYQNNLVDLKVHAYSNFFVNHF